MTELQVGVHGLRTFRVSDDGNLLPVTAIDDSWRGGLCIARCRRTPQHRAPADRCRCGIYTFRNLTILRNQYEPANLLVAVVALEGQTLAGSKGWRSQAGRVVALWVAPGALPDPLLARLRANLPRVRYFDDVSDMLAGYPELSVTAPVAGLPRAVGTPAPRPFPLRPRPVRTHLVLWFLLLLAGMSGLFLLGEGRAGGSMNTGGAVDTGGAMDAAVRAVGAAGTFIAAHDLALLFPLLFLSLLLAARRAAGSVGNALSTLAWTVLAVIVGAVVGAVGTGSPVEFNAFTAAMIVMLGWRWFGLFLFSVGTADGTAGYLARVTLRWTAGLRRVVSPRRPAAGVDYRPRPDHLSGPYPLLVPVHFAPA